MGVALATAPDTDAARQRAKAATAAVKPGEVLNMRPITNA